MGTGVFPKRLASHEHPPRPLCVPSWRGACPQNVPAATSRALDTLPRPGAAAAGFGTVPGGLSSLSHT